MLNNNNIIKLKKKNRFKCKNAFTTLTLINDIKQNDTYTKNIFEFYSKLVFLTKCDLYVAPLGKIPDFKSPIDLILWNKDQYLNIDKPLSFYCLSFKKTLIAIKIDTNLLSESVLMSFINFFKNQNIPCIYCKTTKTLEVILLLGPETGLETTVRAILGKDHTINGYISKGFIPIHSLNMYTLKTKSAFKGPSSNNKLDQLVLINNFNPDVSIDSINQNVENILNILLPLHKNSETVIHNFKLQWTDLNSVINYVKTSDDGPWYQIKFLTYLNAKLGLTVGDLLILGELLFDDMTELDYNALVHSIKDNEGTLNELKKDRLFSIGVFYSFENNSWFTLCKKTHMWKPKNFIQILNDKLFSLEKTQSISTIEQYYKTNYTIYNLNGYRFDIINNNNEFNNMDINQCTIYNFSDINFFYCKINKILREISFEHVPYLLILDSTVFNQKMPPEFKEIIKNTDNILNAFENDSINSIYEYMQKYTPNTYNWFINMSQFENLNLKKTIMYKMLCVIILLIGKNISINEDLTILNRIIIFSGPGATSKSILVNLISCFITKPKLNSTNLNQITNRFEMASIISSSLLLFNDETLSNEFFIQNDKTYKLQMNALRNLCSSDLNRVEPKFEGTHPAKFNGIILLTTNSIVDYTIVDSETFNALNRRLLVFYVDKIIKRKKQDLNFLNNKILPELANLYTILNIIASDSNNLKLVSQKLKNFCSTETYIKNNIYQYQIDVFTSFINSTFNKVKKINKKIYTIESVFCFFINFLIWHKKSNIQIEDIKSLFTICKNQSQSFLIQKDWIEQIKPLLVGPIFDQLKVNKLWKSNHFLSFDEKSHLINFINLLNSRIVAIGLFDKIEPLNVTRVALKNNNNLMFVNVVDLNFFIEDENFLSIVKKLKPKSVNDYIVNNNDIENII